MIEASTTPDRGYMGDIRRGASLGRATRYGSEAHRKNPVLFHLRKIRLDSGGYDPSGAYWGHGGELYEAWDDGGEAYMTFRSYPSDRSEAFAKRGGAPIGEPGYAEFSRRFPRWWRDGSREAAKDQVRKIYPNARFYR